MIGDAPPSLMSITCISPSESNYELRSGELLEVMAGSSEGIMTFRSHIGMGSTARVWRGPGPHTIFMNIQANPGWVEWMKGQCRHPLERYIVDVCAPVLRPELIDPGMNSPEAIAYYSDPENLAAVREVLSLASVVTINHPDLAEMIQEVNPNVYLLPDFNSERADADDEYLKEATADLVRILVSASQVPPRCSCKVKRMGLWKKIAKQLGWTE